MAEENTPISPTAAQRQDASVTSEDDVLEEMRDRFSEAEEYESENHEQALDDLRFVHGEGHWTDEAREARGTSRPMLTVNKLAIYLDNVLGDFLQDEVAVKVAPARLSGEEYVTEGGSTMTEADVLDCLVRDIERESAADDVYEWGMDNLLACGTGCWRVVTEYCDDDTFEQRIRVESIDNPLAVYLDPAARRADKLDAAYGFILYAYSDAEAKRRWPDLGGGEFDHHNVGSSWEGWWRDGSRLVAEYFRLVPEKAELLLLSDGTVVDAEKFAPVADELAGAGVVVVEQRTVQRPRCEWRLVTASRVLEGPTVFPSRYIPIIQTEGRRLNIAGRKYRRGLITNAKDAARGYSYMRTTEVEVVALQPKAPWIAAAEQVEGFDSEWRQANTSNRAVLRYNHIQGIPPPARQMPPQPSGGLIHQSQAFDADMQAATGVFTPMLGESEYQNQSGAALRQVQNRGTATVFPMRRAHARGVRKTGTILCDMVPRVYNGPRLVRLTKIDGDAEWLQLHKAIVDEETGAEITLNNLSSARASISVRTGPAYATRRLEAVNALLTYLERDPQAAPIARDIIAKNLDIPGAQELAARFRRTIPKEVLGGADAEEQTPPTAAEQADMAEAQADMATAEAKVVKANADRLRSVVQLVKEAREAGIPAMQLFAMADAAIELGEQEAAAQGQAMPQQGGQPPGGIPGGGMA